MRSTSSGVGLTGVATTAGASEGMKYTSSRTAVVFCILPQPVNRMPGIRREGIVRSRSFIAVRC
jgi:hypothetical protein